MLPPLDGLPTEIISHLEKLEQLEDESLRIIMLETVPRKTQKQISGLLQKLQAGALTEKELQQLAMLQKQADLVMLRKARAASILHFRGHQLPTLAELQNLTSCN